MIPRIYHIHRKIVFVLFIFILIWICLAVLDPVIKLYNPSMARLIHELYSPVCHQISERSFQLNSFPLGFCIRCSGFYFSGALILFIYIFRKQIKIFPLHIYIILSLPLLCDFILGKTGIYQDLIVIRFITGAFFGLSLFHLLVVSLSTRDDVYKVFNGEKYG